MSARDTEDKVRQFAEDLDSFAKDYDRYAYNDAFERGESSVSQTYDDILNGNADGIQAWLSELADDPDDMVRRDAKALSERLDALGKEIDEVINMDNTNSTKVNETVEKACQDFYKKVVPDFDGTMPSDYEERIQELLTTLTPREEKVFTKELGLKDSSPKSKAEIADELGVSVDRVNQIEAKGLRKAQSRVESGLVDLIGKSVVEELHDKEGQVEKDGPSKEAPEHKGPTID